MEDYWRNGNKRIEFPKTNNTLEGKSKWWNENGQLRREIPYVNGERHGLERWWHENSKLRCEIPYANGKAHGLVKFWNSSGELLRVELYNNNIRLMRITTKSSRILLTKRARFK